MMPKILHVSHSLETGGGPLYIRKIIEDVPGVEHYVAGNTGYYYDLFREKLGARRVARLAGKNLIKNLRIILALCKQEGIQVIHCHGRGAALYSRLVKLVKPDIRIIYTVHGFHPETVRTGVRAMYILMERMMFRYTDYVIHVSLSERSRFLRHVKPSDPSRCLYIPNYITASDIPTREVPVMLEPTVVNLVYVGRLGHEKGIDILVNAMILLRKKGVKLWVIGYGPMEAALVSMVRTADVSEHVIFLGKYDGASAFLRHFDAIVIPSRFEGMPFIGLEAMISKAPIICTPAVGITDLVTADTAYMSRDFEPASLEVAINAFLKDRAESPESIQHKVDANYRTVQSDFSPANAEKLGDLYRELNSIG